MLGPFRLRRLFRFSLGSLLLVMLCVCGYFGGYRWGQVAAERDRYNHLPSARIYDLSDMMTDLPTTADRQRLYRAVVAHLKAAVPREAWSRPGAQPCDIHPFPATHSLAVMQRGELHEPIAAALDDFRRRYFRNELQVDHVAKN